jgi:hypothetical protein
MTIGELRKAVTNPCWPDDAEVVVWIPGSKIILGEHLFGLKDGRIAIEGNVEPGSALGD